MRLLWYKFQIGISVISFTSQDFSIPTQKVSQSPTLEFNSATFWIPEWHTAILRDKPKMAEQSRQHKQNQNPYHATISLYDMIDSRGINIQTFPVAGDAVQRTKTKMTISRNSLRNRTLTSLNNTAIHINHAFDIILLFDTFISRIQKNNDYIIFYARVVFFHFWNIFAPYTISNYAPHSRQHHTFKLLTLFNTWIMYKQRCIFERGYEDGVVGILQRVCN